MLSLNNRQCGYETRNMSRSRSGKELWFGCPPARYHVFQTAIPSALPWLWIPSLELNWLLIPLINHHNHAPAPCRPSVSIARGAFDLRYSMLGPTITGGWYGSAEDAVARGPPLAWMSFFPILQPTMKNSKHYLEIIWKAPL